MRITCTLRPSALFLLLLLPFAILDVILVRHGIESNKVAAASRFPKLAIATAGLGLTDLCLTTEARYTRHPAVTDRVAPFMNHPGAFEHFPTGSFYASPWLRQEGK